MEGGEEGGGDSQESTCLVPVVCTKIILFWFSDPRHYRRQI